MAKNSKLFRDQQRKKNLAHRERRQRHQSPKPDLDFDWQLDVASHFATQIGCESPQIVGRLELPMCEVAECHHNAMQMVHFNGGRVVWGWHFVLNTIVPDEPRVDAVFHAVWEHPDGVLFDITPRSERVIAGQKAGVFMPLDLFCEDKRYYREWQVEDAGHGMLGFRTLRQVFPEQQACSLQLYDGQGDGAQLAA